MRPASVEVIGTSIADGKTTFVVYFLKVHLDDEHWWTLGRRFSEFVSLRKSLVKLVTDLPVLAKTWLPTINTEDAAFIEQRRLRLHAFVLACMQHPSILVHPHFLRFIGIVDQPVGDSLPETNKMHIFRQEFQNLSDPLFGVNEFIYDEPTKMFLTAAQDVFVVSRVDSYFSNIKLPWEKEDDAVVPVGTLNLWGLQRDEAGVENWTPVSVLYYKAAVVCLAWWESKRWVAVGLDDGRVFVYMVDRTFLVVKDVLLHSARCVGVAFDEDRSLLITASKDKKIVVMPVNMDGSKPETVTATFEDAFTSLAYDSTSSCIFAGTLSGPIAIYQLSGQGTQLTLAHVLPGHTGAIAQLCYNPTERYLFSASLDGRAGIWKIERTNLSRSRNQGWLQPPQRPGESFFLLEQLKETVPVGFGQKGARSVCYAPERSEIIVGFDEGSVYVWNILTGNLHDDLASVHTYAVTQIRYDHATKSAITSGEDGRVKFWSWAPAGFTPPISTVAAVTEVESKEAVIHFSAPVEKKAPATKSADPQSYFLKSSGVGSTSDRKDAKFVSGTGKNVNTRHETEGKGESTTATTSSSSSSSSSSSGSHSSGNESGDDDSGSADNGEEKSVRKSESFAGTLEGFFDKATSLKSETQEPKEQPAPVVAEPRNLFDAPEATDALLEELLKD